MLTLFSGSLESISWLMNYTRDVSILICLIFVVRFIAAKSFPAWWSYSLWLVLLVRMLIPWQFKNRLNISNLFGSTSINNGILELVLPAREVASPSMELMANTATNNVQNGWNIPVDITLLLLWLTGVAGFGVYILIRNARFWTAIKQKPVLTDKNTLGLLAQCKTRLNIQKRVDVIITDKIGSPALFGYFHPRLLLPQGIIEQSKQEELVYVFMHEMGHLKRHDIAVSCLSTIFQTVHWFNPLVWLAFYQMRIDQESACDATVLKRLKHDQPVEYANAIVSFLERYCHNRQLSSMAGILENKIQMKRRLAMIVNYKKSSKIVKGMAATLLIIMGFIFYTLTGLAAGSKEISDVKLPESNKVIISILKDGRVFFSIDGLTYLRALGEKLNDKHKLGLTEKDLLKFSSQPEFGMPLSAIKQFLELTDEQQKIAIKQGIPTETVNNELRDWLSDAMTANPNAHVYIKVNYATPFSIMKRVMGTLQECNIIHSSLIAPGKTLYNEHENGIMSLLLPEDPNKYIPPKVAKKLSTEDEKGKVASQSVAVRQPENKRLSAAPPIAKDQQNFNSSLSTGEAPKVLETHVLNVILSEHNKIYWYIGLTNAQVRETDYFETGIRKVLRTQNQADDKLVVLIKPDANSTYENLVDILNEMALTSTQRYALVGMEDEDRIIIQKHLEGK
jgi:beta-lactamase regulating signal transducer with metallopeptidase domain/biopolymer transport protein ExbD